MATPMTPQEIDQLTASVRQSMADFNQALSDAKAYSRKGTNQTVTVYRVTDKQDQPAGTYGVYDLLIGDWRERGNAKAVFQNGACIWSDPSIIWQEGEGPQQ